ncbi:MAG: hypothetical protein QG602_1676 [Verrucomicrobiota bacterium]|nr:hypothetical protein [Verrucomicrobiota bacterium]
MHTRQPQPPQASFRLARSFRLVATLACAGATLHPALRAADPLPAAIAAPAAAETGVIEGRVFNAESGTYLNNARVIVEGTNLESFTNDRGEFRLRNVPAGEASLKVTYTGQEDLRETVQVSAGATATSDFTFNSKLAKLDGKTVVLDKFVVEAARYRNAQELSINEERYATNIKSVVALDSLGYVKDGNIGEFVRFLPGVDVSDGALGAGSNPDNAATVAVRGFGADSTAILIDGVPMASGSPSALSRAVQLDAVSVNNASRLEIIKVATPDMKQDAPGGTINLISRGAFELPRPTYNISVAFNGNTLEPDIFSRTPGPYEPRFKTLPSIRASATIPLSKTLGVSVSASSDNKYSITRTSNMRDWFYSGRNTTGTGVSGPVQNANGGIRIDNPVIDRFELNEAQWLEYRKSGSLRVDWLPLPGLEVKAGFTGSIFDNIGMNRRTQWRYSNAVGIKDWGDGYVTGFQRTSTFNPSLATDMNVDARDRKGFTTQGYINAKYRNGPWSIDASLSASESFNSAPDRANRHFSSVDGALSSGRMDLTGIKEGVVGEIKLWDASGNPLDYSDLTKWNPILVNGFRARSSESNNRDLKRQYKLDVARELEFLPFPLTLKAGGLQETKSIRRWGAGATYELRYTGPTQLNADITSPYTSIAGLGYAKDQQWMDGNKIYEIYEQHPEWFNDQLISSALNVHSPAANYISRVGNTKGLDETTTDGYVMATAKFFNNRLTIITGARQSHKSREGYNVFNDPNGPFVQMPDGTRYRDSVYVSGVRFDGSDNTLYPSGDPRRNRNAILTDTALRARIQAAGAELPTALELSPNGTQGTQTLNMFMAKRTRYTRYVDVSRREPVTPQFIADYSITDTLKAQVSWSKEHRLPDIEGTNNALLVGGSSFQISEANVPDDVTLGGHGTITLANLNGEPEINNSYNFKLAYYPKNGAGRYSISYYYKVVDNVWETTNIFNDSSDYDALLQGMGLSSDDYANYRIDVTQPLGVQQIRKGFEVELTQNFGIFAPWAKGIDAFVTYTRRPAPINTGGESRLGWVLSGDVRAKWTGGVSYSTRRFQVQARATWTEAGKSHNNTVPTVTLPDGTTRTLQMYNLNETPPDVRVQANYVLNKNFTLFATAERLFTSEVHSQIADAVTGYQPEWASYRGYTNRGMALSLGVNATF